MIFIECNRDELLITSLGFDRDYEHAGGKGNVITKLKKTSVKSIGIIDEDPTAAIPPYLKQLTKQKIPEYFFTVYFDDNSKNNSKKMIIEFEEKLENWIIKCAGNTLLNKYQIPTDPDTYHHYAINKNEQDFMKEFIDTDAAKKLKNQMHSFLSKA